MKSYEMMWQRLPLTHTEYLLDSILHSILNGRCVILHLPSVIICTVIGNCQQIIFHHITAVK